MQVSVAAQKAFRVLRREGPAALVRKVAGYLGSQNVTDAFDKARGTDTAGIIPVWKLTLSGTAESGERYEPTKVEDFGHIMAHLGVDPARYTFIDIGCGKGRTLILAHEYGFRRVIGVDFGEELIDAAKKNLSIVGATNSEAHFGDGAAYELPDDDMVLYLYNPFGPDVMERMVERMREKTRGELILIYGAPQAECEAQFEASGFLRLASKVPECKYFHVWRETRDKAAATG